MTLQDLLQAARGLEPAERFQLIQTLWDEFDPKEWPQLSQEWIDEIERRSAALDSGEMSSSPWSEVKARTRRRAGLDG